MTSTERKLRDKKNLYIVLIIVSIVIFASFGINVLLLIHDDVTISNFTQDFKTLFKFNYFLAFLALTIIGLICMIIFSIVIHGIDKEIDEDRLKGKTIFV